jgi:hypothetical protein
MDVNTVKADHQVIAADPRWAASVAAEVSAILLEDP